MPIETRTNNALFRRADQLKRWELSETNKVPDNVASDKKTKIKFSDGCVFLAACAAGDTEEVEQLLEQGSDINTANVDGLTALHQACIDNDLEMVQFLVEHNCDVNRGDNEGWTPLHATSSCGLLSIAKYLVEHGANVAAVNNDADLPIDISTTPEMEEYLSEVIDEKGIDCDEARSEEERIMLADAKLMASSAIDINDKVHPQTGATPLHVAAAKGYLEVLKALIEVGADLNAQDNDGWTPLHAASHWNQKEACAILTENLANMDIQNFAGQTCFDICEPECIKLLVELKKKQVNMQKERPEIMEILKRTSSRPPLKRRTSVTRMSGDEKSKSVMKDTKSERAQIESLTLPEEDNDEDKSQAKPLEKSSQPPSPPRDKYDLPKVPTWKAVVRRASEEKAKLEADVAEVILKMPKKPNESEEDISPKLELTKISTEDVIQSGVKNVVDILHDMGEEISPKVSLKKLNIEDVTRAGIKNPKEILKEMGEDISPKVNVKKLNIQDVTQAGIKNPKEILKAMGEDISPKVNVKKLNIQDVTQAGIKNPKEMLKEMGEDISPRVSLKKINIEDVTRAGIKNPKEMLKEMGEDISPRVSLKKINIEDVTRAGIKNPKEMLKEMGEDISPRVSLKKINIEDVTRAGIKNPKEMLKEMGEDISPKVRLKKLTAEDLIQAENIKPEMEIDEDYVITDKRPSLPPVRDEESELQRKAHAKRVRETRRSTQGVLLEDIKSAELQYLISTQQEAALRQEQEAKSEPLTYDQSETSLESSFKETSLESSMKETSLESSLRETSLESSLKETSLETTSFEERDTSIEFSPNTVLSSAAKSSLPAADNAPSVTVVLRTKTSSSPDDTSPSEIKSSLGTQGAIQRRRRPKRRSTGVVYLSDEATDESGSTIQKDFISSPESLSTVGSGSRHRYGSSSSIPDTASDISSKSDNSRVSEDEDYKKPHEDLKKENEDLKKENEDLKKTIKDIKRYYVDYEDMKTEIKDLKKDNLFLKKESADLKKEKDLKKDYEDVKTEIKVLKKENIDLKKDLKKKEEELKKDTGGLKKENEGLKKENEGLKKENEGLKKEIKDIKKHYEDVKSENKRLIESLRKKDDEIEMIKLNQGIATKNSSSEADKRERRSLERKISEMEEELKLAEKWKEENEQLMADYARLRDENGALIRVISKLSQ